MNILDYAWSTATSIAQRDYDTFRLILDETLTSPVLGGDSRGFVVKLPPPKMIEDKLYAIQGLYAEQEESGWNTVWRLFKGSLYHLSLHASFSDFKKYAEWAKTKDPSTATFTVSLVEDLYIMAQAKSKWPGILPDTAFCNYISAMRLREPDEIDSPSLRIAAKLLLSTAGVFKSTGSKLSREEDKEVEALAETTRIKAEESMTVKPEERGAMLIEAAKEVYSSVSERGSLREIPFLPYTESHGACDLFEGKLLESTRSADNVLSSALAHLGLEEDFGATDPLALSEGREILVNMGTTEARQKKIKEFYDNLISPTRLNEVEFPPGDYANFMRVKSALAGPIKTVKGQLMLVKNVLDDVTGHESGQQLDTQAAMQVMASGQVRSDVFEQLEPMYKEEAWAILLDASKSLGGFSHETKGIAVCLAEVAKTLIPQQDMWAMYSFNNSIQVIKDFSEDYSMTCKARMGGLTQRNSTLLPDAITTVYKTLAAKSAAVKILVVVSDGYPSGYNDIEKKLVSTIKEVSKSGVLLMGIGVDSNAIKQYFAVNCVMSTPYELMKTFVKSYYELSYMF